jgi:uncharacterized phage infection (PIP) family protein YhgE
MSIFLSLFTNSSAANTEQLVREREAMLAKPSIDEMAEEAEHLRLCIETLEKSNSTIVEILAVQKPSSLTAEQMSEMLRKLTCVMTTDLSKLSDDLQKIRQNKPALRQLVQAMRGLHTRCQEALQRLESAVPMEEKNIEDLMGVREKAMQAELQPTCRDGSTLL